MRKYIIIFISILAISVSAQQKIGYIDSQKILSEYKGALEIRQRYESKVKEWRDRAENLKNEIESLRQSLQAQNMMLSEEAKLRKMEEIESKQREYQQFIQRIWGESGEAETLNQELMQPLLKEIDTLLTKIGEEEGFSVILDVSSGALVYAEDELDITDRVLDALNKKYMPEEGGRIEYHVFKFREEDSETKSRNLGEKVKNLIDVAIKGTGGFEVVEKQLLENAVDNFGIINEEEITEEQAGEILKITDGDFIIIGRTWIEAGDIYLEYLLVDKKQGQAVIQETEKVGVEDNLNEVITSKVVNKITDYYK